MSDVRMLPARLALQSRCHHDWHGGQCVRAMGSGGADWRWVHQLVCWRCSLVVSPEETAARAPAVGFGGPDPMEGTPL